MSGVFGVRMHEALQKHPDAKTVAFVHAETSTGVLSNAPTLAQLARQHGCLTIVDAVTSLRGTPLLIDEWQLDAVYASSQKCLSCILGLSPVTLNQRSVDLMRTHESTAQSWFMDLNLIMDYWGQHSQRVYHHTAPVNSIYALHEALRILAEESLEKAWQRHARNHNVLRAGIEAMGLAFLVDTNHRLPQLNAIKVPDGIDGQLVRRILLEDYGIEIGGGLGELKGKVWRIGLMGHASNAQNVLRLLLKV